MTKARGNPLVEASQRLKKSRAFNFTAAPKASTWFALFRGSFGHTVPDLRQPTEGCLGWQGYCLKARPSFRSRSAALLGGESFVTSPCKGFMQPTQLSLIRDL